MSYNDVNLELLQKAAEEGDAEAQKIWVNDIIAVMV